jgi:hypothetical protein
MSLKYKVIDNFLPAEKFKKIHDYIMNEDMLWTYTDFLVHEDDIENPEMYGFTQMFYISGRSHYGDIYLLGDLLEKLKVISLLRIRANLLTKRDKKIYFKPHYDHAPMTNRNAKYTVGIYYINTNNGCTVLDDGTEIDSVANRMVLIPGNMLHGGATSTDTRRVLINFNFISADTPLLY